MKHYRIYYYIPGNLLSDITSADFESRKAMKEYAEKHCKELEEQERQPIHYRWSVDKNWQPLVLH